MKLTTRVTNGLILGVVVGNTTTSKQIKMIGVMHVAVPAQFCPFSSFYKS